LNTVVIAFGKPFKASTTAINIIDASGLEFIHNLEPEFGALSLQDPKAKDFFLLLALRASAT
jgi:hypothetical protein